MSFCEERDPSEMESRMVMAESGADSIRDSALSIHAFSFGLLKQPARSMAETQQSSVRRDFAKICFIFISDPCWFELWCKDN